MQHKSKFRYATPMKVFVSVGLVILIVALAANFMGEGPRANLEAQSSRDDQLNNVDKAIASEDAPKAIAPAVSPDSTGEEASDDVVELGVQLDGILAGTASIVEFIQNNIDKARDGDPDAAFYVSLALFTCGADMMAFGMTIPIITNSGRVSETLSKQEMQELRPAIKIALADKPEFFRSEAERKMDRAIDCVALGQPTRLMQDARELTLIATSAEHPLATIMIDNIDDENLSDDDLARLKKRSREYLQTNKDRQIFFHASEISAISLEKDPVFEKLSWAIAACEYNSCDTLSRIYRGSCEMMSLEGTGDFCTDDITDYDYLLLKYPEQFDRARARSMEIISAIESERWDYLGL